MACLLVIEPIFEADFEDHSYGFRPKRSAQDAIVKIKEHLRGDKTAVYDADLSKYFDSIPHEKLKIVLRERIKDQRVLKLINKWLKAPVNDDGQYTGGKKNKVGVPQGAVVSPLLSNLYLHLLDRIVNSTQEYLQTTGCRNGSIRGRFCSNGKDFERDCGEEVERLGEANGTDPQ